MKYAFGLLVFLLALSAAALPARAQEEAYVEGVITNTAGTPLPYASVQVVGSFTGTAANAEGRYQLSLPAGAHVLRFRALGYEPAERSVRLAPGDTLRLEVALAPAPLRLGQVTVEAARETTAPSTYRLTARSLKRAPALGEPDVVRTVALLPGIAQPNDLKAGLSVRGGAPDQNLFLLDGIPVYNPNHLLGLFSAFNPWALSEVTAYAGRFPVRYGGRLSSVIALRTKTRRDSSFTRANVSLISASAAATRRWNRTFVLAAARRTYLDPVLAAVGADLRYRFHDANLKLVQDLGAGLSLEVMGFTNRDAARNTNTRFQLRWGNYLGALRLRRKGRRLSHTLTASYVQHFTRLGEDESFLRNRFHDLAFTYDGEAMFSKSRFSFGGGYRRLRLDYGWRGASPLELDEVIYEGLPNRFAVRDRAPLYAAYLAGERYLTPRLRLQAGLRYSSLGTPEDGALSPRLGLSYRLNEAVHLTAGAGRYLQHVAEGREGVEFTISEPIFLLERPQQAWTYTLGAEVSFGPAYRLTAEAYYRDFDRVARLQEGGLSFPDFGRGTGAAYGLDLFLKKSRGWLTYQLGYSFLRTRVEYGGEHYPPAWSLPHTLQGLLGARLGPWRIGLAGTFRSGLPYTPVLGQFVGVQRNDRGGRHRRLDILYIPGPRNSERLPVYTRVDLSLRRTYQNQWFTWDLYVQAINLFNSTNALRVDLPRYYSYGRGGQAVARSLPVIPSVGVELIF